MKKKILYAGLAAIILLTGCIFFRSTHINEQAVSVQHPRYVIIGCSAAGFFAATELAKLEPKGIITCISEEAALPYNKTTLHAVVSGKKEAKDSFLRPKNNLTNKINFLQNTKIIAINRNNKTLTFGDKQSIPYDKLLIATGAEPFVPAHLKDTLQLENIVVYNTLDDVELILKHVSERAHARVLIVGAGIRSLELADGLLKRNENIKLTVVNRSDRFLGNSSDDAADGFIKNRLATKGINFLAPLGVLEIKPNNHSYSVRLTNNQEIPADLVVFAMGTKPRSALAHAANIILLENGSIKVDDELRTSDPNIFAAGDVISFQNPFGPDIQMSNKWRAAKTQGRIAAQNMASGHKAYHHEIPAHISSFFGFKVIISGDVRSAPLTSSFIDTNKQHYFRLVLNNERIQAFILLWDQKAHAPNILYVRKKLLHQTPVSREELKANLMRR